MSLGEVAQASEQWALATQAFTQAQTLGVDDERGRQATRNAGNLRIAEGERRREAIEALFDGVETGRLAGDRDALRAAALRIVPLRDAQTVALASAQLARLTGRLAAVREREADTGLPTGERLRRWGVRQGKALGPGRVDLVRLCCLVLGHLGDPGAVGVLGDYLAAEADALRAVPAGLALCRLGGVEAIELAEARR